MVTDKAMETCRCGAKGSCACGMAAAIAKRAATPPPASADALGEVEIRALKRTIARLNREAEQQREHFAAALSAMSPAGEGDGWIVGNADGTQWRTWEDGLPLWTGNIDHACRYARRIDAESVHQEDEDAWRIIPYTKGPRHD